MNHRLTDTLIVVYRNWSVDPAILRWKVWVILPSADEGVSAAPTIRQAYYIAHRNARRYRPRPFQPASFGKRDKKYEARLEATR